MFLLIFPGEELLPNNKPTGIYLALKITSSLIGGKLYKINHPLSKQRHQNWNQKENPRKISKVQASLPNIIGKITITEFYILSTDF